MMLETWLGSIGLEEFRATYLQRAPLAQPATARDARELLDWSVLSTVLGVAPAPDVLVVAGGALLPWPAPSGLGTLGVYLGRGAGLCIRRAQRSHPGLARVAAAMEATLPGARAEVQLFVTPGSTHGFGWHYDDEDVFIVQTVGAKDYFFRANTIASDRPAHGDVFMRFAEEQSPICTARLHAGDFLYLPARWWHMARCLEDALSISIGVSGAR